MSGAAGAICGPKMRAASVEDAGTRWCFRCRKQVQFTDTFLVSVEPSYWEPFWERRCARGHIDGDMFPGRGRGGL